MPITAIQRLSSLRTRLEIPNRMPSIPGKINNKPDKIFSTFRDKSASEDSNSVNRMRNITDSANRVREIAPRLNLLVEFSMDEL